MSENIFQNNGIKKKICFSGFSNNEIFKNELFQLVENLGGEPSGDLSKRTFLLVVYQFTDKPEKLDKINVSSIY